MDRYATYDPSTAGYGSASEWKRNFRKRMSRDEAVNILQEDDPYVILGVSQNATAKEIQKAYRALAFKWHPDRNPENMTYATEMMKKINAAYDLISYWR